METKISVLLADPGEQYRAAYSKAIGQETDMELVAQYHMDLYFESAGTILTLVSVGKYWEARSKSHTADALQKLIARRFFCGLRCVRTKTYRSLRCIKGRGYLYRFPFSDGKQCRYPFL